MKPPSAGPSWATVIILLIVFWPVGLFMLIKKLGSDRSAVMHKQSGVRALGIVLVALGILLMLADSPGMGFFLLIGGVVALVQAGKTKKKGMRYRQYIDLVVNRGVSSIDTISQMTGYPYNKCVSDLAEMVNHNYFPGAYVDLNSRMLARKAAPPPQPVYAAPAYAPAPQPAQYYVQQPVAAPAAPAGPRVVQCSGCGANNTVYGPTGECEYCGSRIGS